MNTQDTVRKYLNEDWTPEERQEIEESGENRVAKFIGEYVFGSDSEADISTGLSADEFQDVYRDIVFGPETDLGKMYQEAMIAGAKQTGYWGHVKSIQEHAEWNYLSRFFDDAEEYASTKLKLYREDTEIELSARTGSDGNRVKGEKSVHLDLLPVPFETLEELTVFPYDFSVRIDAPANVSLELDGDDLEDVRQEAVAHARNQVDATDSYTFTAEFEGGDVTASDSKTRVNIYEYPETDGEETDVEQILNILNR